MLVKTGQVCIVENDNKRDCHYCPWFEEADGSLGSFGLCSYLTLEHGCLGIVWKEMFCGCGMVCSEKGRLGDEEDTRSSNWRRASR